MGIGGLPMGPDLKPYCGQNDNHANKSIGYISLAPPLSVRRPKEVGTIVRRAGLCSRPFYLLISCIALFSMLG
jgi:hypothetical protein